LGREEDLTGEQDVDAAMPCGYGDETEVEGSGEGYDLVKGAVR